jgi:hypothetical protein
VEKRITFLISIIKSPSHFIIHNEKCAFYRLTSFWYIFGEEMGKQKIKKNKTIYRVALQPPEKKRGSRKCSMF